MIQFPETARAEWQAIADVEHATASLRARIERGVSVEKEVERLRVRHEAQTLFNAELVAGDTPALEMGSIADFIAMSQTTVVDLIDGVLKDHSLCTVLGPSGVGKTTVALQMLHSLLTGDDWLGQPVQKIDGRVGILSYDQNSGMMANWIVASGMDVRQVLMVNAHGRGNPLAVPEMRAQIANTWRAAEVEVILVDSFSASFAGADQNDTAQTMTYYRDMMKFAYTEVGARALLMIVHSTAASPLKARGSTAHKDVADSVVAETWTDPQDITSPRQLQMVKYREGIGQTEMSPVIVTYPDDVTHLVGLDTGAMTLANLPIPASVKAAAAFTVVPQPIEQPDTDSEKEVDTL